MYQTYLIGPWEILMNIQITKFQANLSDWWQCQIPFRWLSLDVTDNKSTLVQVMAWCHQASSHYLNQCWPGYGVTWPQWVNHCKYYLEQWCPISMINSHPLYIWNQYWTTLYMAAVTVDKWLYIDNGKWRDYKFHNNSLLLGQVCPWGKCAIKILYQWFIIMTFISHLIMTYSACHEVSTVYHWSSMITGKKSNISFIMIRAILKNVTVNINIIFKWWMITLVYV